MSKYEVNRQLLHTLSKVVHPFDIRKSNRQASAQVQLLLNKLVEEIRILQKAHDISDSKNMKENFATRLKA